MYFSVQFDLPTGATIVCTFGLVLIMMATGRVFRRSGSHDVRAVVEA
jgi:ABC-type Mn2+/Zn2+ transport system permease subunit